MDEKQVNNRPPGAFKPGQSGNPKGRPKKGYSITEWFRDLLKSDPEVKNKIGKAIVKKALYGDMAAIKLIWNYMDGMPQANMKSDDDRHPMPIIPLMGGLSALNDGEPSKDDAPIKEEDILLRKI